MEYPCRSHILQVFCLRFSSDAVQKHSLLRFFPRSARNSSVIRIVMTTENASRVLWTKINIFSGLKMTFYWILCLMEKVCVQQNEYFFLAFCTSKSEGRTPISTLNSCYFVPNFYPANCFLVAFLKFLFFLLLYYILFIISCWFEGQKQKVTGLKNKLKWRHLSTLFNYN